MPINWEEEAEAVYDHPEKMKPQDLSVVALKKIAELLAELVELQKKKRNSLSL